MFGMFIANKKYVKTITKPINTNMKKLTLIAFAMLMMATFANAQIANSAHNFSTASWNSTGEICKVCHTPHNANTLATPLWNHDVSTQSYTTYSSSTLNAVAGQPAGMSKLCLSCHDGTVALNNFGGNTYSGAPVTMSGTANLGTNLSNDHPVSFTYNDLLATTDGGLFPPTTTLSGVGSSTGHINDDMLFGAGHDQMECSSCHDVHNSYGLGSLLIKSNAASALCLTCHDK